MRKDVPKDCTEANKYARDLLAKNRRRVYRTIRRAAKRADRSVKVVFPKDRANEDTVSVCIGDIVIAFRFDVWNDATGGPPYFFIDRSVSAGDFKFDGGESHITEFVHGDFSRFLKKIDAFVAHVVLNVEEELAYEKGDRAPE